MFARTEDEEFPDHCVRCGGSCCHAVACPEAPKPVIVEQPEDPHWTAGVPHDVQ